jgi:hypothetical protein
MMMSEGWDVHIGPDSVIHVEHGWKHSGSVLTVQQGEITLRQTPDMKPEHSDQYIQANMVIPGMKATFWDGKTLDKRFYYVKDRRLEYTRFNDTNQGDKQGDKHGDQQSEQDDNKQTEQGPKQADRVFHREAFVDSVFGKHRA